MAKPKFIPGLQTRNVFAGHCRVTDNAIAVENLVIHDPKLSAQRVTLVPTLNPMEESFHVQLPEGSGMWRNIELQRV